MLSKNFFDFYPRFYATSNTTPFPNRLNNRYVALIYNNRHLIEGSSILDLASHDGRWSFAAIKTGAKYVVGIEAREYLVDNAIKNMETYAIAKSRYQFIIGDIHSELKKLSPRNFDIVFCFGFFYHTIHHAALLSDIQRLKPKYLILDTGVSSSNLPIIEVKEEDSESEPMAIRGEYDYNNLALIGIPSRSALELLLRHFGFKYTYIDWHSLGITNWEYIDDYFNGSRVSVIAERAY